MIITIIGIMLNLLVFGFYIGNKSIPRSFSNKLLLHQCFVDLVNLAVLILPYTCRRLQILMSYCNNDLSHYEYVTEMVSATLTFADFLPLSAASSAFTFTLEAADRLLASLSEHIYKQFKERKVILSIIITIWFASLAFSVALFLGVLWYLFWEGFKYFLDVMMLFNTILIGAAFYKSRKKLKNFRISFDNQVESQNLLERAKRDFRLTLIFFIMYIIYLVPAIGVSVGVKQMSYDDDEYTYLIIYSLSLASTLNPVLTLTLKEDFKGTKVRSIQ